MFGNLIKFEGTKGIRDDQKRFAELKDRRLTRDYKKWLGISSSSFLVGDWFVSCWCWFGKLKSGSNKCIVLVGTEILRWNDRFFPYQSYHVDVVSSGHIGFNKLSGLRFRTTKKHMLTVGTFDDKLVTHLSPKIEVRYSVVKMMKI